MDFNVFKLPSGAEVSYGKNLYILGTAENGPLLEPQVITTEAELYKVFGKNGSLIKAWRESYQIAGNKINIRCVRVNGQVATSSILDFFRLTSINAGAINNLIQYTVYEYGIEIRNPLALNGESYTFSYDQYQTIGQLIQVINELTRAGKLNVWASTDKSFERTTTMYNVFNSFDMASKDIYLKGGEDGIYISKNELHECLDLAYNILEGQPVDIICVADAFFDDVSPLYYYGDNKDYAQSFYIADRDYLTLPHEVDSSRTATFHGQLIDFCYKQLACSIVTHGVMAFNPLENIEDIFVKQAYLNKALFATCLSDGFDLITKSVDDTIDHGKFISLVLGEFVYTDSSGLEYYNNGYAGYAAMLCLYLTPESMTNKLVPNISAIRYHLDDDEISTLSKMGVTTFRYSLYNKGIVVSNGVTASLSSSPYHNVSNTRMIQMTMAYFKILLDEYIGEDVQKLRATKSIEKAIDKLIITLRQYGIIQDIKYVFTINSNGYAVLNLNILAIYSVEYVDAVGKTKL